MTGHADLLGAALRAASGEEVGVSLRVLPLAPGGKLPHPGLGFRTADGGWRPTRGDPADRGGVYWSTADLSQVGAWWRQWPQANVGVATDALVLVDVEGPGHRPGYDTADVVRRMREAGYELPRTRAHDTAGRGVHLFYLAPPGSTCRSRAAVVAGADVLGTGRYAAWPPSRVGGRRYAVRRDLAPVPAPDWLLAAFPARSAPLPPTGPLPDGAHFTRYGRRALLALLDDLGGRPVGQRAVGAFAAAARFGELAGAGHVAPAQWWRVEAVARGLFPDDWPEHAERVGRCLADGLRRGGGA
jgi:hypothetical protein